MDQHAAALERRSMKRYPLHEAKQFTWQRGKRHHPEL